MRDEETAVVEAARGGDEAAFGALVRRYRPELQVHCYRMLGSVDDSEDLVQETFLRAWRRRSTYRGDATFRAWLYRIATNACLDVLARRPVASAAPDAPPVAVRWLRPYPDRLLAPATPGEAEPDAAAVSRETLELAFLAAIQHLPPRQRAVLILRDVLGWSARETAEQLETTVASVNSALQRARPALRERLPDRRLDWGAAEPTPDERAVLQRYMAAIENSDDAALAALLREDVRVSHQPGAGGNTGPEPGWYSGRDAVVEAWAPVLHGSPAVDLRLVPTSANRRPAAGTYIRTAGDGPFEPFGLAVLRVVDGAVAEVTVFGADAFPAFSLPARLDP